MNLIKEILIVVFLLGATICMIVLAIGAIYQTLEECRSYRAMMDKATLSCFIVVRPGKSYQDIKGFFGWSGDHKPIVSSLPKIFHSRTLAQIVADQLNESEDGWVVWDVMNVLKEAEKAYGQEVTHVICGECSVPHNKWTGCPKLGGKIPPDDYSCGQGERA